MEQSDIITIHTTQCTRYQNQANTKQRINMYQLFRVQRWNMIRDSPSKGLFSLAICFRKEMSSRIDPGIRVKELGGLYINFDGSKSKPVSCSLQKLKEKKIQDEVNKRLIFPPSPLETRTAEWIMDPPSYARTGKSNNTWDAVPPARTDTHTLDFGLLVSDLRGVNGARWFAVRFELLFCVVPRWWRRA